MYTLWDLLDVVIKLTIAALCGGLLGVNRMLDNRLAGMRSMMLVSLGSALFIIVTSKMSLAGSSGYVSVIDSSFYIIIAVSILAGAYLIRNRGCAQDIPFAVTLWIVAGIGIAIGTGFYLIGFIASVMVYTVVGITSRIFEKEQ